MSGSMISDGLGDPFRCHSARSTGLVGRVVELFENLLHLNLQDQLTGRGKIIIRELVQLRMKQRTQFFRIDDLKGCG